MKLTYKQELERDYLLLQKQLFWLDLSYKEAKKTKLKEKYDFEQYQVFETLSTRYCRSIEFLLQKSFVSLDTYEFKNQFSQIELIQNAANRKIIKNTDEFRDLYSLRIKLLNEYNIDNLTNYFEDLYFNTKLLIVTINKTLDCINKAIR